MDDGVNAVTLATTVGKHASSIGHDFRAKATFWVATAAVLLLLPIAIADVVHGDLYVAMGSFGIVAILTCNAWLVKQGRCHQKLTLFGLVPAGMIFMIGVFEKDGIIASLWCYPSILACYCMLSTRRALCANACILAIALPMIWMTLPSVYCVRFTATMLAMSMFSCILVVVIDKQHEQLSKRLTFDPLTGLLNRLTLAETLETAVANHDTKNQPASLLAIDVDYFKAINDRFGHHVGDEVLTDLGMVFEKFFSESDRTFRTGGEEFLVLLTGVEEKEAVAIAERLRVKVAAHLFIHRHAVTISLGVAAHRQGESWPAWNRRCDERLYSAKRRGRDQVSVSRDSVARQSHRAANVALESA